MSAISESPKLQPAKATSFLWWTIYPPPDKELAHLPETERRQLRMVALQSVRKRFKSWRWQLVLVAAALILISSPPVAALSWKYLNGGQLALLLQDVWCISVGIMTAGLLIVHWRLYRKTLRQHMLEQGLRPRLCF